MNRSPTAPGFMKERVLVIRRFPSYSSHVSDVTRVIEAIQQGDPKAADELLPLVYEELRKLAASKMANEAAGNTLQPTALVHEAWMRLVGVGNPKFPAHAP